MFFFYFRLYFSGQVLEPECPVLSDCPRPSLWGIHLSPPDCNPVCVVPARPELGREHTQELIWIMVVITAWVSTVQERTSRRTLGSPRAESERQFQPVTLKNTGGGGERKSNQEQEQM